MRAPLCKQGDVAALGRELPVQNAIFSGITWHGKGSMRFPRLLLATVLLLGAAALPLGAAPAGAADSPADLSGVLLASSAPGSHWTPEAATYGVGSLLDQPVRMADGTVLRADVYFPTDSAGRRAGGSFPVVLTQTPYGKQLAGDANISSTGPFPYLVERGYIDVVADVRGTGDSQGSFGLFDPVQDTDGVTLVNWAAHLPGSNGKVGLYGASYLGINQLLTAGHMPANSPLKAIFPIVPANDVYQDTEAMGGLLDLSFDSSYLALTGTLNTFGPLLEGLQNPAHFTADLFPAEIQHLADLGTFDAAITANGLSGGTAAFDDAYWQSRNPANVLQRIVANNIPAYIVGGEYDLFQRGEPMDYAALQNAWAGRSVAGPMLPTQQVTGRYQLLVGPWTHLVASTVDVTLLELEWFDTWLKGEDTGMGSTPTPLHYWDLGTGHYTEQAQYPFAAAHPTRYYFSASPSTALSLSVTNHTLTTAKPTAAHADTLLWSPVGNPCGRPSDQWTAGGLTAGMATVPAGTPCFGNDLLGTVGLDRATYTTAPFATARTLAGPIDVSVYATANTTETQWVAQVEDVAPDGTAVPLSEGALLGSLRAQQPATTWLAADGQIIKPGHPYTAASQQPVVPGRLTRYDIEVFPTYATIARGHRIRLTLSTADTPHLIPTLPAFTKLLGGVYHVQISPTAPSAIELPLI
jgi:putative CocE/NonD family hydrolase